MPAAYVEERGLWAFLLRWVLLLPWICFSVAVVLNAWFQRSPLKRVPYGARLVAAELDEEEWQWEEGEKGDVPVPTSPEGVTRYAAYCGKLAKAEFGLLRRTEANRLMVQKFLRDEMRSHNVRNAHIAQILPIAVEVSFVPNSAEVMARQLRATTSFVEADAMLTGWGDVPTASVPLLQRLGVPSWLWRLKPGLVYESK